MISWKDPSEWMEQMRGPRWRARVTSENKRFDSAVRAVADKEQVEAAITAFQAASEEWEAASSWVAELGSTRIQIYPQNGGALRWTWLGGEYRLAGDIALAPGTVVYSEDIGKGAERYKITAMKRGKVAWSFKGRAHGLGSNVAVIGQRVYMLEASLPLRYKWLISVDLATGGDKRIHYEEMDSSCALTLVKGESGCLFLLSDNAGRQKLFHIIGGRAVRLSEDGISFFPVGFAPNSKEPCYLVRRSFAAAWEGCGAALKELPVGLAHNGIDHVILREKAFVHRKHGERFVDIRGKRVARLLGEIQINPWWFHYGGAGPIDAIITMPGRVPFRLGKPVTVYAEKILTGMAKSPDGTGVRWIVVWNKNMTPRGVIINGYGAYNIPTNLNTTRWKPYLDHGIAIGFAMPRGGGDYNDMWAEAGRVHRKEKSVHDFEACVRAIRGALGLSARQTVVFGRSAGGYLVGAATALNPGGELFGTVYTEVPYVDVLKTASNERLPLTKYEYLEFGDPLRVIADFETMLRLGPVSALDEKGAPGVYVICRTAVNDRQVYAYESVKWMDALRGKGGEDKLLAISGGQGHFTRGDDLYSERAADYLLLLKRIFG